jgi:hypothetical protein
MFLSISYISISSPVQETSILILNEVFSGKDLLIFGQILFLLLAIISNKSGVNDKAVTVSQGGIIHEI